MQIFDANKLEANAGKVSGNTNERNLQEAVLVLKTGKIMQEN